MKKYINSKGIFIILLLYCFSSVSSAIQWRGPFSLANPDAHNVKNMNTMKFGSGSSKFVASIGGVSFDQMAGPVKRLKIKSLKINYSSKEEDGSRLRLLLNNKRIKVSIYDWLLIPIARYADSPYYSCFTLFGKLKDKQLEKVVLNQEGRIMNYHPYIENTLLGLRLYHMDILIMYNHTIELPMENDRYILGAGEPVPDIIQNRNGLAMFSGYINQVKRSLNQSFRSYVITDFNQKIFFSIKDNSLNISGRPYYFFWRHKFDRPGYNINMTQKKILQSFERTIDKKRKKNPSFNVKYFLIDSLIRALKEYEGKYAFYSSGSVVDCIALPAEDERRAFLERFSIDSLFQTIVNIRTNMDAYAVDHLKKFSKKIFDKPELLRSINPAVWDATVATLRYAAFFRYCKKYFPEQWNGFIDDIKNIVVMPIVKTPTIMYPGENKKINKKIKLFNK